MKGKEALFCLVFLLGAGVSDAPGADAVPEMYTNLLSMDLTQSALSWQAGGFGLTLGYEHGLGNRFSLQGEIIYMSFPVDLQDPELLLALVGIRYYFSPPAMRGFFAGLSGMAGGARERGVVSFQAGLRAKIGFAWRLGKNRRFLVEPYIMYPYIFGEDPLIGIAPGFSLGFGF